MAVYAYVSLQDEDRIAIFGMDPATGALERQGDAPLPGMPAPLAIDPLKRYLFAGRRTTDDYGLSSFRIDRATGGLSSIGGVPLAGDPVHISTDRTGAYLLSAHYYQARTPSGMTVHCLRRLSNGVKLGSAPIMSRPTPATATHLSPTSPTAP